MDISSLVRNLHNVRSCTLILVACLLVFLWQQGMGGGVVGAYENDLFTFNVLSPGTRLENIPSFAVTLNENALCDVGFL